MKKIMFSALAIIGLASCNQDGEQNTTSNMDYPKIPVTYPQTVKEDVKDDYFGISVTDPYRWLENDTAANTEAWVKAENEVTQDYLSKIPFRSAVRDRFEELFNYPKYGAPYQVGEYYFFSKNDGLQNQSVLYRQKGLEGTPEVFIDPNKLSEKGTAAIAIVGVSGDDKYMTVSRSDAGSDWSELMVYEVATMKQMPDVLKWVKFSGGAWWKNGFFYSRYPEPAKGTELSGNNMNHWVYYHKLGDPQSSDKLIYKDEQNPSYYHNAQVTEDEKHLFIYAAPGTDGFAVLHKDLSNDGPITTLFEGYKNKTTVIHNVGDKVFALTDIDAPNYRLVEVDLAKPDQANWKDIIPESENLLENCSTGGGKLYAGYLEKATNQVYEMNYDGSGKKILTLPGVGSASTPGGRESHKTLFYTFTSFLYPPTIFKYDVTTGQSSTFQETKLKFDPADYEEKQVTYKSKDGTPVTMFVVHKKGLKLDGTNPCYLYGYGGFNISLTPGFSTSRIMLLENGGVFAMPNLRGGGEYGEAWHKGGMLMKKQNVFDDFIAAAEYLIAEKYTSKEHLGIAGGSNGGLLVGACMTQRPDLFAVALPAVGVMDMLRYHKFTVGKGWAPEYGTSEQSAEMFNYLREYSPVHNIMPGVSYPATLVTTGDHDDRVVPAHSFKFAATLQASNKGDNPVLIRIETDAGHGAGKPTSKVIDEIADVYSFFFYNRVVLT
ncbi:MAG: prolyl oligopeptidase family serine peptidase [Bacteroidetes bacterium]|nr:prolyl oligopeptidase family serine peptidase [Bacteroidota bacterium]